MFLDLVRNPFSISAWIAVPFLAASCPIFLESCLHLLIKSSSDSLENLSSSIADLRAWFIFQFSKKGFAIKVKTVVTEGTYPSFLASRKVVFLSFP